MFPNAGLLSQQVVNTGEVISSPNPCDKFFWHWDVHQKPIASMYGVFAYIWLIFMVNVGNYTIHGSYGYDG